MAVEGKKDGMKEREKWGSKEVGRFRRWEVESLKGSIGVKMEHRRM